MSKYTSKKASLNKLSTFTELGRGQNITKIVSTYNVNAPYVCINCTRRLVDSKGFQVFFIYIF